MPLAIVTIVATVWALARSNEFEQKAVKAAKKYGSANPMFVVDESESEIPQPTSLQTSEPRPTLERRAMPIPIAATDTN